MASGPISLTRVPLMNGTSESQDSKLIAALEGYTEPKDVGPMAESTFEGSESYGRSMQHGFVISVRPFRHVTASNTHIYNCSVTSPNGWQASGLIAMQPRRGSLVRSGSHFEDWIGFPLRRGLLEHLSSGQVPGLLSLVAAEIQKSDRRNQ